MTNNNNQQQYPSWAEDQTIHAYFVVPGRLLAGEYPNSTDLDKAPRKRAALLDAGVTSIVDLTEPREPNLDGVRLEPYKDLLMEQAKVRGATVKYARFAIPDNSVINDEGYNDILAHIQSELEAGEVIYLHCYGGKGRTGTVVGCWLIDNEGIDYDGAIRRLKDLRRGSRKADHPVPDSLAQHDVLRRRAQRREA
jgi:hypothetical protein